MTELARAARARQSARIRSSPSPPAAHARPSSAARHTVARYRVTLAPPSGPDSIQPCPTSAFSISPSPSLSVERQNAYARSTCGQMLRTKSVSPVHAR